MTQVIADEKVIAEQHGQVIIFKPELPKENVWRQPAIYVATMALFIAIAGWYESNREARMAEYYSVDLEVCLTKRICPNSATVPADPWGLFNKRN